MVLIFKTVYGISKDAFVLKESEIGVVLSNHMDSALQLTATTKITTENNNNSKITNYLKAVYLL